MFKISAPLGHSSMKVTKTSDGCYAQGQLRMFCHGTVLTCKTLANFHARDGTFPDKTNKNIDIPRGHGGSAAPTCDRIKTCTQTAG